MHGNVFHPGSRKVPESIPSQKAVVGQKTISLCTGDGDHMSSAADDSNCEYNVIDT
jgi:hypothetical protein